MAARKAFAKVSVTLSSMENERNDSNVTRVSYRKFGGLFSPQLGDM